MESARLPRWPIAAWPARARAIDLPPARSLSRPAFLTLAALAFLLAALPLAVVDLVPQTDYPFHLARVAIMGHWDDWPTLHRFYEQRSFLLPNVAMDVILLGFAQILPLEIAGRAFVALTLLVMLSGVAALHWSLHRRLSPWPLAATLVLHNWIYVFGFLNYLFGVGLMLWGLAVWIMIAARPAWQRLVVGGLVALAIFFAHMVAFGLYALALAGWELQRALPALRRAPGAAIGRLAVGALPFVPPLLLFALLSETGREAGSRIKYMPEWYWKLFVVARTFMSMNLGLDFLTAAVLLGVAVLVLLRGRLLFAREMLLALGLLVASFLVIPWKMFGAVFVDARFPAALLLVAIAASQLVFTRAWAMRAAVLALGGLLVVRSLVLTADWQRYQPMLDGLRAALGPVPAGSVILSVTPAPPPADLREWTERWRPPVVHAASLALLDKPVFAVNTWATPSQQPIAVTPAWRPLYALQEQNPMPTESAAELDRFLAKAGDRIRAASAGGPPPPTYVLLLYPDYLRFAPPPSLTRVADGPRFMLFKLAL